MEFINRAVIIGVNQRDLENPTTSPHIYAEVLLIDKSNEILHPLLYQLHSDALSHKDGSSAYYQPGIMPIEDNAFAMIGEVLSIDKTKKLVYLTKNMTVSYKHLIVASGLKQSVLGSSHDDKLSAGVNALVEALRVRRNIPEALTFPEMNHLGFNRSNKNRNAQIKIARDIPLKNIQNILDLYTDKPLDRTLGGTEKRLYQVQL